MSDYRVFGAAAAFADRADAMGVPATAAFQLTDRCNYRCAHCYEVHDHRGELSFDEVARILDELARAGVLFLTLTGGEVYLRRDIDEILAESRRLRFAVRLYTTGHFIDEARAARLRELAIQEVHLSLYGPDVATHEEVTRMSGSFERTVAAAKRLRAQGIAVVLKSPVMSVNIRKHDALRELVDQLGCRHTMDPKLTVREDGERSPLSLRPSLEDLTDFYRTFQAEASTGVARDLSSFDREAENREGPCGIGTGALSINPRGLVFGCASLPVPIGDLRKQSFLDVWQGSRKLKELRAITWNDIVGCRDCELRPWCSRCHAMALLEDGNMLGPSREACRHAVALRESLRARGRLAPETSRALPTPLRDEEKALAPQRTEPLAYGFRPAALRVIG